MAAADPSRMPAQMPGPAPAYLPDYAPVAERVRLFYERHPTGRILTRLVRKSAREVVFQASVYRTADEAGPSATGWACEREGDGDVNTVACLENSETSAVGRALANLGFLAGRARASAEEMAKAARARSASSGPAAVERGGAAPAAAGRSPAAFPRPGIVCDLERLLERARHVGLRPARVARWRARLLTPARPWTADELLRVERWLRAWIRRQPG